jgi:hypothetical protein
MFPIGDRAAETGSTSAGGGSSPAVTPGFDPPRWPRCIEGKTAPFHYVGLDAKRPRPKPRRGHFASSCHSPKSDEHCGNPTRTP